MKKNIGINKNLATFLISSNIYPKSVIYKACYTFIDKAYVLLDDPGKNKIKVTLKWKSGYNKKTAEDVEGEFMNELLNALVRENVSKQNKRIVEQIVGGAIAASLGLGAGNDGVQSASCGCGEGPNEDSKEIEEAVELLRKELAAFDSAGDYESDELGVREIVVPEDGSKKRNLGKKPNNALNRKNNGKSKKN